MTSAAPAPGSSLSRFSAARLLGRFGPLLGLLCVWGLFAVLNGRTFVAWENQRLMLLQTAVVGTAAVGATFIIVSRGIDLSVGSTIALGTVVVALTLKAGYPPSAALLAGVGTGFACGAAIGAMVIGHVGPVAALLAGAGLAGWLTGRVHPAAALLCGLAVVALLWAVSTKWIRRLELSPFIVTLGMWGALRGAAKGLGNNQPVYPDSSGWLAELMMGRSGAWSVLPPGVWIFLALAVLAAAVLHFTRFGRHVYAVGSNELTARLCGVAVERTKLLVYVLGVGCAGVAAVLQFSYLSMGDPTTAEGYELRVIAAVVIGGASLSGGEGGVAGTLIGAMIMTVVDNGCTRLGLENWVQDLVTGGIILAAVALDRARQRRGD